MAGTDYDEDGEEELHVDQLPAERILIRGWVRGDYVATRGTWVKVKTINNNVQHHCHLIIGIAICNSFIYLLNQETVPFYSDLYRRSFNIRPSLQNVLVVATI